jgi:hypothetical protein
MRHAFASITSAIRRGMLSNVAFSHVNQFEFVNSFLIRAFNTLVVSGRPFSRRPLKGENATTLFKWLYLGIPKRLSSENKLIRTA